MTDPGMAMTASWQMASADRGVRLKALAAARRHSRWVRTLRVFLPLFGVASLVGYVMIARLQTPDSLDLGAARLSVTRSSIIMDRPELTGFDRNHRAYSLSAERAIQPIASPGQVRLETITAKVEGPDGKKSTITAEAGDYDHTKRTLKLYGAIAVDSGEGYTLNLTDADSDFGAGTLVSKNPVTIGYGDSSITGSGLSVSGGGKVIVIEGRVHTLLMPPRHEAGTAGAKSGNATHETTVGGSAN